MEDPHNGGSSHNWSYQSHMNSEMSNPANSEEYFERGDAYELRAGAYEELGDNAKANEDWDKAAELRGE